MKSRKIDIAVIATKKKKTTSENLNLPTGEVPKNFSVDVFFKSDKVNGIIRIVINNTVKEIIPGNAYSTLKILPSTTNRIAGRTNAIKGA